jgi:hypothetical protein
VLSNASTSIVWKKDGCLMEAGDEFEQYYDPGSGQCMLRIDEV